MLSRVNSGFLCASPHVSRAVPDGRGSSCERPTPARFRSSYSARPHDRVVYPRSRVSRRPMQPGDRRGLASKSASRLCTRPPHFCKYANRSLTSRFCSVIFRPMHNLYENIHSGSVVCEKHLGYEATAGFTAKPDAKTVKTSFGTVLRMSDARRTAWLLSIADIYPSGCECCK